MLNLDTAVLFSIASMFLASAGAGIGGNQPFTTLQAALKYVHHFSNFASLTATQRRRLAHWKRPHCIWLQLGTQVKVAMLKR
jgi:hypothetical protein